MITRWVHLDPGSEEGDCWICRWRDWRVDQAKTDAMRAWLHANFAPDRYLLVPMFNLGDAYIEIQIYDREAATRFRLVWDDLD